MFVCLTGLPARRLLMYNLYIRHSKGKLSRNKLGPTVRRGIECWAAILTWTFDTAGNAELSAARSGRTLPPRKYLGTHFC